jgi:hypothetical protein
MDRSFHADVFARTKGLRGKLHASHVVPQLCPKCILLQEAGSRKRIGPHLELQLTSNLAAAQSVSGLRYHFRPPAIGPAIPAKPNDRDKRPSGLHPARRRRRLTIQA